MFNDDSVDIKINLIQITNVLKLPTSLRLSVFVIVIAALNLFLDFDEIEKGAAKQMPKYMEWFSAMGLMITLVWLYVEFLRLLSKLSSRD